MVPIPANQLIYSNVEADQSPNRRRGYQTLYYTRTGLDPAEVVDIESRLFYVPKGEQPVKRVFFSLRTGKLVLAQVVPVQGTDQFGRSGRYLAHALAFSPETFAQLDNNPFGPFRRFSFCNTVDEALTLGDFATGNIPPAQITASPADAPRQVENPMERDQLRTLLLLAAQASRLIDARQAVGFFGSSDAMFQLLERLFLVIPPPLRPYCSFDTLFLEGTLGRLPYWAIGLPIDQPRQRNLLAFHLEQQRFMQEVVPQPTTPFERWLVDRSDRDLLGDKPRSLEAGYWLSEWLLEKSGDQPALAAVDDSRFQAFVAASRERWGELIRKPLVEQVGAVLADRLLPHAFAWTEQQGAKALQQLEQGFDTQLLIRWMIQFYGDPARRPQPGELRDLKQFLTAYDHPNLRLIYSRWAGEWDKMARMVRALDDEVFRSFANWTLGTISLQVDWAIYRDKDSLLFGPEIVGGDTGEAESLLCALLGVPAEQSAAVAIGAGGSSNPPLAGKLQAFVGQRGSSITRWLMLIKLISERCPALAQNA